MFAPKGRHARVARAWPARILMPVLKSPRNGRLGRLPGPRWLRPGTGRAAASGPWAARAFDID